MIYAQDRRPQSAKKVQQILKSADLAIAKQAISNTPIVCEQTGGEELLRIQWSIKSPLLHLPALVW